MGNCFNSTNSNKSSSSTKSSIDWSKYNFDNTKLFSLNELYLECRVVDIYDGDTCTCVLPLFDNYYKFTIRLADIDTCEMKSKSDNKDLANKARKYLFELITKNNKIDLHISRKDMRALLNENVYLIRILCGKFDKYGRLLGHLFKSDELDVPTIVDIENKSFNYKLINEHLAYKYEGATKLTEIQQIKFLRRTDN
jgi:endonuclease YncB( thermonuclease family)